MPRVYYYHLELKVDYSFTLLTWALFLYAYFLQILAKNSHKMAENLNILNPL